MILITGPASQGKTAFAGLLAKDTGFPIIDDVEKRIYETMLKEMDAEMMIRDLTEENPEGIFVLCEIGSGIVPMSSLDRAYRDLTGRIGQYLASRSSAVYRLCCGIPQKIK